MYAERDEGRWVASDDADNDGGILRLTADDAATIQTYPQGWGFTDRPAMTVHGHGLLTRGPSGQKQAIASGLEDGTFLPRPPYTIDSARKPGEQRDDYLSLSDRYEPDAVNFTAAEAAVLQSYPAWAFDRPAMTVAGDSRMAPPGCKHIAAGCCAKNKDGSLTGPQFPAGSVSLTAEQMSTLQAYPVPFPFQGNRGKQFLQIGNAVPPLMAEAILRELITPNVAQSAPERVEATQDALSWDDVFSGVYA